MNTKGGQKVAKDIIVGIGILDSPTTHLQSSTLGQSIYPLFYFLDV